MAHEASLASQAEYVGREVVDLIPAQMEIGHLAVRCLQKGPQAQRGGRLHARDGGESRCAVAGTVL